MAVKWALRTCASYSGAWHCLQSSADGTAAIRAGQAKARQHQNLIPPDASREPFRRGGGLHSAGKAGSSETSSVPTLQFAICSCVSLNPNILHILHGTAIVF